MRDALLALATLGVFSLGTLFGAWVVESDDRRRRAADALGPLL